MNKRGFIVRKLDDEGYWFLEALLPSTLGYNELWSRSRKDALIFANSEPAEEVANALDAGTLEVTP